MIFVCGVPYSGNRLIRRLFDAKNSRVSNVAHESTQLEFLLKRRKVAAPSEKHYAIVPVRDPAFWSYSVFAKDTVSLPGHHLVNMHELPRVKVDAALRNVWRFCRDQLSMLAWEGIPTLVIRYEDLVANPEDMLKKFLDHVQVPEEKRKRFGWNEAIVDGNAKWRPTERHLAFRDLLSEDVVKIAEVKDQFPDWDCRSLLKLPAPSGAVPALEADDVEGVGDAEDDVDLSAPSAMELGLARGKLPS